MKQSATLPQRLRPEFATRTPAVQYRAAWIANLPKKKFPALLLCFGFPFSFSPLGPLCLSCCSFCCLFFVLFVFFLLVFFVSSVVLCWFVLCSSLVSSFVCLFCFPSLFLFVRFSVCLLPVCLGTITDVSFGSKHSKITHRFRLLRAYGSTYKSPCTILPDATQSLAAPIFGDI